jgi:hypothetical protein
MPESMPTAIVAPFRGIEEAIHAKMIGKDQFVEMHNMVLRSGRPAPRPGYQKEVDASVIAADRTVCEADYGGSPQMRIDWTNEYIYFSASDKIYYVPWSGGTPTEILTGAAQIGGIAIDVSNNNIYYTEEDATGKVRVKPWTFATVTSAGAEADVVTGENFPNVIDVDSAAGMLYWASFASSGSIRKATTAGASVGNVVTGKYIEQIVAYPTDSKLFYTQTDGVIGSVEYTGANDTSLRTGTGGTGSGLDVDTLNTKLVYAGGGGSTQRFYQMDLDGGNHETIIRYTSDPFVYALVMNPTSGEIVVKWDSTRNGAITAFYLYQQDNTHVISAAPIMRNVLDVDIDGGDYAKDIVFMQLLDIEYGHSNIIAYLPASDTSQRLNMGIAPGTTTIPGVWATNDKDAVPSISDPFSTKSGRCSWAWMGEAVNTGKGGFLFCNGDGAYVATYMLGCDKQTITEDTPSAGSGADSFTITFDGETTENITRSSSALVVQNALLALPNVDGCYVTVNTSGGIGFYVWTIVFTGVWAGKNAPLISVTGYQDGGSDRTWTPAGVRDGGSINGSYYFLRPAGLPTPKKAMTSAANGSGEDPSGYYEYLMTYVSSILKIESPAHATGTIVGLNSEYANVGWTLPSGSEDGAQYFTATDEFGPLIDKVRIYRRKLGSFGGGASPYDGTGDRGYYQYVGETSATALGYDDDLGDLALSDVAMPTENDYPPANASFVVIQNDMAIFASNTPGDFNIWRSEVPKTGSVHQGELGFEYVRDEAFSYVVPMRASDAPFTGLVKFDGRVFIGTPRSMIAANIVPYLVGRCSFKELEDVSGLASHWMVVKTGGGRDAIPRMLWMSPQGWVYQYVSGSSTLVSRGLSTTAALLIQRYWNDVDYFLSDLDSWHFCSAGLDFDRNRVIFNVKLDSDKSHRQLVLDLDSNEWCGIWDLTIDCMIELREYDSGDGILGRDRFYFAGQYARVHKLVDGKGDDGSTFTYRLKTGLIPLADIRRYSVLREFVSEHAIEDFGGSDAAFSVKVQSEKGSSETKSAQTPDSEDIVVWTPELNGRRFQITIEGTQADDQSHAELLGMYLEHTPSGRPRK